MIAECASFCTWGLRQGSLQPPSRRARCSASLLGALASLVSKFSSVFLRSPRRPDPAPIPVSSAYTMPDSAGMSHPKPQSRPSLPSREQHRLSLTSSRGASKRSWESLRERTRCSIPGHRGGLGPTAPLADQLRGKNSSGVPGGIREKLPELRLLLHHTPHDSQVVQDSVSPLKKPIPYGFSILRCHLGSASCCGCGVKLKTSQGAKPGSRTKD